MRGCHKFTYEAPNWTASNQSALNQIMQSLTKACIIKSFEVCTLLRYYTVQSSNSALTFWATYQSKLQGSGNPKERTEH